MVPKPKPAAAPPPAPAALDDLFATLHRHVQDGKFTQAAKAADQILAVAPDDEDAIRCKVVALVKSDAIDRALAAIRSAERLPIDLTVYKAYCYYRQNKLQEALDLLHGQERTSFVLQLESQIYYRLGRMDACMDCFETLQKANIDMSDLKINLVAALVAAGRSSEVHETLHLLRVDLSINALKKSKNFELAYNFACALIDNQKYAEAKDMLDAAKSFGKEVLMEDYAEEEAEYELAPIAVQQAYVSQLLENNQEALEAYARIANNKKLADPSSYAIAINNLISMKSAKDVSDSLRKLDQIIEKPANSKHFQLADGLDFKLSARQKEALYSNRLLLLLHANRIEQAHELASALLEMFPNSVFPILLQAAVFVREKKVPKAEEFLKQYADKNPDKSEPVLLALAQIAASHNHFQISADSLAKVTDIQHMPATVATLVSLKVRLNDVTGTISVFNSAIDWWKNSMTEDTKLNTIMREAATFKLNHGAAAEAAQIYEELVKTHGSVKALAGLVSTAASSDIEKAELYEKQLKPLLGIKKVNVESLEKTSGARNVEVSPIPSVDAAGEATKKQKAKKRKRKPKYPKGFDPANPGPPPDPERWLPRRERSSYRPKRKDKRAQVRGAQGSVARDKHDSLTVTAVSGANTSTSSSSSAAASSSKSGQAAANTSKGGGTRGSGSSDHHKGGAGKSKKKSRS